MYEIDQILFAECNLPDVYKGDKRLTVLKKNPLAKIFIAKVNSVISHPFLDLADYEPGKELPFNSLSRITSMLSPTPEFSVKDSQNFQVGHEVIRINHKVRGTDFVYQVKITDQIPSFTFWTQSIEPVHRLILKASQATSLL